MVRAHLYPAWKATNAERNYPFADGATLTNGTDTIPVGMFLDAHLNPVGGQARQYLSRVTVATGSLTLAVSDDNGELATGSFDPASPPATLALLDSYERSAGVFVLDSDEAALLGGWSIGAHAFTPAATSFVCSVTQAVPEEEVRGFILPEGDFLAGDVWLVGGQGVVFTDTALGIQMDVVGDPDEAHRNCEEAENLLRPATRFVRTINDMAPNQFGNFMIVPGRALAEDNIIRVEPEENGLVIKIVGGQGAGD